MTHKRSMLLTSAVTALLAGPALPVAAYGAAAGTENAGQLEEIVVTARLRSEELQQIPLAIQALTGEALERAGVQDMRGMTEQFAGLQLDTTGGRFSSTPVIRGLSQVSRIDDENNVSLFVDGIYVSGRDGLDSGLLDIERVEVVRGPQSALYGRNSYAGAINYITRAPNAEFGGKLDATLGSDGKKRGAVSLSGPVGDSGLGYRVAYAHDEFDGSYGRPNGLRLNGYKADVGSAALRWKLNDAFEANLTAYYTNDNVGPSAQVMFQGNCQAIGAKNIAQCGAYPSFGDSVDFSGMDRRAFGLDREILRTGLRLNWNLGPVAISSLTGYNTLDQVSLVDWERQLPGLPFTARNTVTGATRTVNLTSLFTGASGKIREFSQDVRAQSNTQSPLQWTVGTSYFNFSNRSRGPAAVDTSPLAANEVVTIAGFLPGMFVPVGANPNPLTDFPFEFSQGEKLTRSVAGYGALSYTFADALTIRGEIRYTNERKTLIQYPPKQTPNAATVRASDSFKYWTPRFTADYQMNPDVLFYTSVAKGAKAGGFNSAAPTPGELAFGPETNWTYEIGAKTDWLDKRVRVNLSVFKVDMKDIQITNPSPNAPAAFITANAGTGKSEGFELELAAKATENLRITASYSLADAKFVKARDGSLRSYPGFAAAAAQDVSGQRLPRQAKNLANLGFQYEAPAFGAYRWYLTGDGRYESSKNGFTNRALGWVGARTIVNSRLGFTNDTVDVSLWVKNLTNDDTPTLANTSLTLNDFLRLPISVLPDLRSYGVSATYKF
jgi:iron complex outermembrane receptor protein